MERITREQYLIEAVKLAARRGTCLRAQVGCIIVREGRILVTGYNGSLPGEPHCLDVGCQMEDNHCVRTIHAEANAICFAAKHGIALEGTTLYSYGWKGGICPRCRKLCLAAGIKEMVEVEIDVSQSDNRPYISHHSECGILFPFGKCTCEHLRVRDSATFD